MIRLANVNKFYPTRGGDVQILRDVNLTAPSGERVGILGRNGAGKSTLVRLVSGAEVPTNGVVERHMSVSWPLAFGGAFQGSLTGLDNLRFICRVYGQTLTDTSGSWRILGARHIFARAREILFVGHESPVGLCSLYGDRV